MVAGERARAGCGSSIPKEPPVALRRAPRRQHQAREMTFCRYLIGLYVPWQLYFSRYSTVSRRRKSSGVVFLRFSLYVPVAMSFFLQQQHILVPCETGVITVVFECILGVGMNGHFNPFFSTFSKLFRLCPLTWLESWKVRLPVPPSKTSSMTALWS